MSSNPSSSELQICSYHGLLGGCLLPLLITRRLHEMVDKTRDRRPRAVYFCDLPANGFAYLHYLHPPIQGTWRVLDQPTSLYRLLSLSITNTHRPTHLRNSSVHISVHLLTSLFTLLWKQLFVTVLLIAVLSLPLLVFLDRQLKERVSFIYWLKVPPPQEIIGSIILDFWKRLSG